MWWKDLGSSKAKDIGNNSIEVSTILSGIPVFPKKKADLFFFFKSVVSLGIQEDNFAIKLHVIC